MRSVFENGDKGILVTGKSSHLHLTRSMLSYNHGVGVAIQEVTRKRERGERVRERERERKAEGESERNRGRERERGREGEREREVPSYVRGRVAAPRAMLGSAEGETHWGGRDAAFGQGQGLA